MFQKCVISSPVQLCRRFAIGQVLRQLWCELKNKRNIRFYSGLSYMTAAFYRKAYLHWSLTCAKICRLIASLSLTLPQAQTNLKNSNLSSQTLTLKKIKSTKENFIELLMFNFFTFSSRLLLEYGCLRGRKRGQGGRCPLDFLHMMQQMFDCLHNMHSFCERLSNSCQQSQFFTAIVDV